MMQKKNDDRDVPASGSRREDEHAVEQLVVGSTCEGMSTVPMAKALAGRELVAAGIRRNGRLHAVIHIQQAAIAEHVAVIVTSRAAWCRASSPGCRRK